MDAAGRIQGTVIWVDRFGNCITNIVQKDIESITVAGGGSLRIHAGGRPLGALVGYFGEVMAGEAGAILGSSGHLELFCNRGNLARQWNVAPGDPVLVEVAAGS